MSIIFVCRENVGRSQVGAALWNELDSPEMASSAGIRVENPGQAVGCRPEARLLLQVMEEERGLKIGDKPQTLLTRDMLPLFRMVIVLAEPDAVPPWLLECPRAIHRPVPDLKGLTLEETREVVTVIEALVIELAGVSVEPVPEPILPT